MPIDKTIKSVRDYGRVEMHLGELMDRMQINRNTLARSADTRFEVIRKWYDGEVEKMDLDVLARICYVLDCSVSDILEYRAEPKDRAESTDIE